MKNVETITEKISDLIKNREHIIVALDGRCGSGKTTVAEAVAAEIPAAVLHMDDYFLRPEQRTAARLATPGGNVDYERFLDNVLLPLRRGDEYFYQRFDCHSMSLCEAKIENPHNITIIEGTYSCHPALWDYYDLHIFLTVSPQTQTERLEARCGKEKLAIFKSRWIPLEEKYFSAFDIANRCELCLSNE